MALSEADRIALLRGSNMPGGRNSPVKFAIPSRVFFDMAHMPNSQDDNIPIVEHPDDISPTVTFTILDLGTSVLTIGSSEPLNLEFLDASKLVLINDETLNF